MKSVVCENNFTLYFRMHSKPENPTSFNAKNYTNVPIL